MRAERVTLQRNAVCRAKDGYDGHEIAAGKEAILIHKFYCNGNAVKAFFEQLSNVLSVMPQSSNDKDM